MKNRAVIFAGLAAGLFAASAGIAALQAPARKERPAPLIRRDLLAARRPEPPAASRDLFLPGAAIPVAPAAGRAAQAGPGGPPAANPAQPAGAEAAGAAMDGLAIRYIGFVRAEKGIVALVIVDSLPQAVAEGEDIRPGFRVAKISPDRLEVKGPDGVLKPVLREGELP